MLTECLKEYLIIDKIILYFLRNGRRNARDRFIVIISVDGPFTVKSKFKV